MLKLQVKNYITCFVDEPNFKPIQFTLINELYTKYKYYSRRTCEWTVKYCSETKIILNSDIIVRT